MALTHNGAVLDVAAINLPEDYAKPSITTFTDHEAEYEDREFTIDKSTVENADDDTTVDNILAALNTAIEALLNADVDTTSLTVTSYAVIHSLSHDFKPRESMFTDAQVNYVLTASVYYKTA